VVQDGEEELFGEVFGEQEGALWGAGGAEVKGLAGKGAKVFEAAIGIGTLKATELHGVPCKIPWPRIRAIPWE
jgi:hypothetical protein